MRGLLAIFAVILFLGFGALPSAGADVQSYKSLSADQISRVIDSVKGKRTAIFVYASWCPYCRGVMPKIIDIAEQHEGQVLAISLDKDPDTLMRYLQKTHGVVPFVPIVWDHSDIFAKPLARFGIKPGNGIPFTALLDEYGFVHKQGVLEPDVTAKYLAGGASDKPLPPEESL